MPHSWRCALRMGLNCSAGGRRAGYMSALRKTLGSAFQQTSFAAREQRWKRNRNRIAAQNLS